MLKKFIFILLFPLSAMAGKLPEGFQGIPWGAPAGTLASAKKVSESAQYDCYRNGDGKASVAEAAVSNLRLCFNQNRFYFAQMEFLGEATHQKLLAFGRESWGEPKPGQRFTEAFVWGGPEEGVYIELEFSKIDGRGTLVYVYLPVYQETQEASRRERSKPRAGSGF